MDRQANGLMNGQMDRETDTGRRMDRQKGRQPDRTDRQKVRQIDS